MDPSPPKKDPKSINYEVPFQPKPLKSGFIDSKAKSKNIKISESKTNAGGYPTASSRMHPTFLCNRLQISKNKYAGIKHSLVRMECAQY